MKGNILVRKFNKLEVEITPDDDGRWDFEVAIKSVHEYGMATDEGIERLYEGDAPSLHAAIVAVLDRANLWQREGLLAAEVEPQKVEET